MHILLIYGERRAEEALLLGSSADRMRVALRGRADAVEYRLVEGLWMTESGDTVQIGAMTLVEAERTHDRAAAPLEPEFAAARIGNLRAN